MNYLEGQFNLTNISPYSPSKPLDDEVLTRQRNETLDQLEKRIWRERVHRNREGQVIIPATAFKKCIDSAAALTKRKVKGAGNQTFAQQFVAGVMILNEVPLFHSTGKPVTIEDVEPLQVYCSATGDRRGLGSRVFRTYGLIRNWTGMLKVTIVNATISPEIFELYLEEAALLVGVGRWRAEVGGGNGRFSISNVEWSHKEFQRRAA